MAFTTEFVMGAGGSVEEIPVSMSGGGSGNVYPLTTVDAGTGAWVWINGTVTEGSSSASLRPHIKMGNTLCEDPHMILVELVGGLVGGYFTGTVQIDVLSRGSLSSSFTGTVYVARV